MARYRGQAPYRHDSPPATGVLLVNLGTPDAPTTPAVRRYLAEFLSDPRVIETPAWLWRPILHGIILRTRPRRSARAYRHIWTDEGSPLLRYSRRLVAALEGRLMERQRDHYRVELAMRYGQPSIGSALEKLLAANVQRLLVVPLYPQYSGSTTGSVFDAVTQVLGRWRWVPEFRFVGHYHDDEGYIGAVAESIRLHQAQHGRPERLLFSFHGLPRSYFLAGDPYFCHCQKTARLVAAQLGLSDTEWAVSFQSRFGPREWLKPYTDKVLKGWAKAGVKRVQVVCPGFAADCLETLEEIAMQNREKFLAAGGTEFGYIPALNDQPAHVEALAEIVERHCRGWRKPSPQEQDREIAFALERAKQLGSET
jgi:ferrochelatase